MEINFLNYSIHIYFLIFIVLVTIRNIFEVVVLPKEKFKIQGLFTILLFIIFYFTALVFTGYSLFFKQNCNLILYFLGIVIFSIAFIFRLLFALQMGDSYSQSISPKLNGELVTSGIRSIIRHPLYLLYFFEICGLVLMCVTRIGIICIIADCIVTIYRIQIEEQLLIKKYGELYKNYKLKTWKLIPYLF